ncbi:MAG TPA: phosphate ABC transporter permease PstA [Thermoanaerobaculaceae bacterium]|nr:phosphate ABC transporter permease PstA [Thermoanaerobaculaceae bacterium]HRS14664.1 phosphate ABC transporter permease PstA [Thermoanaerobaculaceae bacterium]
MSSLRRFVAEGSAQRWLTASAVLVSLAMIAGLVLVVVQVAGGFFWPRPLFELQLADGTVLLGEEWGKEPDPASPGNVRTRIKVGNRDIEGADYRWVRSSDIQAMRTPPDAWLVERREYGSFFGFPVRLEVGSEQVPAADAGLRARLAAEIAVTERLRREEKDIVTRLEAAHRPVAKLQTRLSSAALRGAPTEALKAELEAASRREAELAGPLLERLVAVRDQEGRSRLVLRTASGAERAVRTADIVRTVPANQLAFGGKLAVYASRWWEFLSAEPREANTEGGILPAIFGTALMVLLMTVAVVPLGVVTAVYLNEYARDNAFTAAVRLALANLAGVPSIVFGAFGLAFFVYAVGGSIDRFFFSDVLPTPTFGTGGILWAALTLALLTLPVVVVATEEGLQSVPQAVRDGARALGATRWQTLRRVVLPYATPGILTGTILAIARGAGEVAPLMLTGVVKLAPSLPLDRTWPFLHLERKFMHLGFHIYDVGFQSPNVEAAKPMVYATVLVLLVLVVVLNLAAILLRNRLRKRLRGAVV